ncbi:MAG: prolyl-tRNA synthetase associated domain-containing protein [Acidimicrobiia bacterium]|nr:prolyl-tRNA synthetase associated domain-containing protein [Acidimicrobiia bacterium]
MSGTAQVTPEELLEYLDHLGVEHATIEHPPVYTVEEAKRLRGTLPGVNCKSLFLKNKKGEMWLVVVAEDHRVDLARLADALGSKRLSFGSPSRLLDHLGVIPGAVTPLAVVNDRAGLVTVAVSSDVMSHDRLNFHPLVNDRTTSISSAGFRRFLEATGHPPLVLANRDL